MRATKTHRHPSAPEASSGRSAPERFGVIMLTAKRFLALKLHTVR